VTEMGSAYHPFD